MNADSNGSSGGSPQPRSSRRTPGGVKLSIEKPKKGRRYAIAKPSQTVSHNSEHEQTNHSEDEVTQDTARTRTLNTPARPPIQPQQGRQNSRSQGNPAGIDSATLSRVMEEFSERISRGLQGAMGNMQASNTRSIDALRTERDEFMAAYQRSVAEMGDKIVNAIASQTAGSTEARGNEDSEGEDIKSVIDSLIEYIKYCTCVEFLDGAKGARLFIPMIKEEQLLRDEPDFVLSDEADIDKFLVTPVEYKSCTRRGEVKKQWKPPLYFAMKGQQRAHDSIRKGAVTAFFSSLPWNHALNPASSSSTEARKKVASEMNADSRYKFDGSFEKCWLNAFMGAIREAYVLAQSSADFLRRRYEIDNETIQLPKFPDVPREEDGADFTELSIFSSSLVSIKITKYIQGIAGEDRSFRKSHAPMWASEVLFCNKVCRYLGGAEPNAEARFRRKPIFFEATNNITALSESQKNWIKTWRDAH